MNKELFIIALFILIFITSIFKVIGGIVSAGEPRVWGFADSIDGIIWIVICIVVLAT